MTKYLENILPLLMRYLFVFIIIAFFCSILIRTTEANHQIAGFNVTNPFHLKKDQRLELVNELVLSGVTAIRAPIPLSKEGADFLILCARKKINVLWIIDVDEAARNNFSLKRRNDAVFGMWARHPISKLDPILLTEKILLVLKDIKLIDHTIIGVEIGNEINLAAFNGDFDRSDVGFIYGEEWLHSARGSAVRDGLQNYINLVAAANKAIKASKLQPAIPVISAGLSVYQGSPGQGAPNHASALTATAAFKFLREKGLSKHVDGYAVHSYPWNNGAGRSKENLERDTRFKQYEMQACNSGLDKPCWLTEWGFSDPGGLCSSDRVRLISDTDEMLASFDAKKLKATFFYSWNFDEWDRIKDFSIQNCLKNKHGNILARYFRKVK